MRRDGVNIDDATAHGILPGGFAHRLGIIIIGHQQLQQSRKGPVGAPLQLGLAFGKIGDRRHRLQQGGRGGKDEKWNVKCGGLSVARSAAAAQLAEYGQAVARRVEGLAHFPVFRLRLGKAKDFQDGLRSRGAVKQGDVLGERVGLLGFLVHHQPDRRGLPAHEFRDGIGLCRPADAGELGAGSG